MVVFKSRVDGVPGINSSVHSGFCFKPIAKEDNLKDDQVSRWQSHYYPTSEPQCKIEKPMVTQRLFQALFDHSITF